MTIVTIWLDRHHVNVPCCRLFKTRSVHTHTCRVFLSRATDSIRISLKTYTFNLCTRWYIERGILKKGFFLFYMRQCMRQLYILYSMGPLTAWFTLVYTHICVLYACVVLFVSLSVSLRTYIICLHAFVERGIHCIKLWLNLFP